MRRYIVCEMEADVFANCKVTHPNRFYAHFGLRAVRFEREGSSHGRHYAD
jgi:hypothetical protein